MSGSGGRTMPTRDHSRHGDKVDRISCLPRPIIHDMLSLLPTKDATRTSLLSKTFYSHWTCFPVIVLSYFLFNQRSRIPVSSTDEEFIDYAVRTIERRRIETDVQKFEIIFPGDKLIDNKRQALIGEMISYAIGKRVKNLSICFVNLFVDKDNYRLPLAIEGSNSVNRLTLMGAKLLNFSLHNWPGLVCLDMRDCSGLEYFKLSSNVIESIRLQNCAGLKSVAIESPSLEIFHYAGISCELSLLNCTSLKKLSLSDDAVISDRWLSEYIPTFSKLENLELTRCNNLKNPKVWNDNLKTISVNAFSTMKSIDIRSENLQSLALGLCFVAKMSISSYKHLKSLSLKLNKIDLRAQEVVDEILTEHVPKSIGLESLKLSTYLKSKRMEIKHERLKQLELCVLGHNGLGEVVVDTPNLVSLNYSGYLAPFRLLNTNALLHTRLKIEKYLIKMNNDYYIKLWKVIASVRHSRFLTLDFSADQQYLIVPEKNRKALRGRVFDNRRDLNVIVSRQQKISAELVDSLLWLWPSLNNLRLNERSIKLQYGRNSRRRRSKKQVLATFLKASPIV